MISDIFQTFTFFEQKHFKSQFRGISNAGISRQKVTGRSAAAGVLLEEQLCWRRCIAPRAAAQVPFPHAPRDAAAGAVAAPGPARRDRAVTAPQVPFGLRKENALTLPLIPDLAPRVRRGAEERSFGEKHAISGENKQTH